jgi:type II secretory pathway component GspD/PulD (secretin)
MMAMAKAGQGGAVLLVVLSAAMAAAQSSPPARPHGWRDAANTPNQLMRGGPTAPLPVTSTEPTHMPSSGAGTGSCRKLPSGRRLVRITLKPDAELGDVLAWISSITCKQFLLPGTIPANSKKVTLIAPRPVTIDDAYQMFLGALNAVDLTVQPTGHFLRIIETSKAKSSPMPFAVDRRETAAPLRAGAPVVTRLVRVEHTQPEDAAALLAPLKGDRGEIVIASPTTLIITGETSNVDRMLEALRELDRAPPP